MTRLVRSELMKIRTTNIWWLFGIGVFAFTAIMLFIWLNVYDAQIQDALRASAFEPPSSEAGLPPEEVERMRERWAATHDINRVLHSAASAIYTSGQFFGVLFVMLLGAILVTNEFFHQTATATFLTTPRRSKVILGKLITAVIAAAFFWICTTALNVGVGAMFLNANGYGPQLGEWPVMRAILMNGLAFGLWGVLGVGLGVLIRSQIGAVITGAVSYVIGSQAIMFIFLMIYQYWIEKDWVLTAMVVWPSMASQIMVSPEEVYPESPAWWVGALVLVGYGIVFGTIGTLITRRRDIS